MREHEQIFGQAPSNVIEERVDRHLALVSRLALEPPEQCVGKQPMPNCG